MSRFHDSRIPELPVICSATFVALTMAMACGAPERNYVEDGASGGASGGSGGKAGAGSGATAGKSGGSSGTGEGGDDGAGANNGAGGDPAGSAGDTGSAGDGSVAGAAGADGGGCPDDDGYIPGAVTCPAGMTSIARPAAQGYNYCIDTLEVTQADFAAFLATDPSNVCGAHCEWNTSFDPTDNAAQPSADCADYSSNGWAPSGVGADLPVVCVDWCDAAAYCEAAGKRLCGAIDGGATAYMNDTIDAAQDQWFRACAGATGDNDFPYGPTYEGNLCNDSFAALGTVRKSPALNFNYCVSSYTVYDLSGNANEWQNSCNSFTSEANSCLARGGGFDAGSVTAACAYDNSAYPRNTRRKDLGFRCCKG